MKLATWNVNSIRVRHDRLVAWLAEHRPDVVCLQEIKIETELLPRESLAAQGYRVIALGQRTYNGVAIAARAELADVVTGFDDGGDESEARLIAATIGGIRVVSVYVPNGQMVGSDKYAYKLEWLARLRSWLDRTADPSQPLIVAGDFNVAPEDRDVHDPAAWAGKNLCSEEERAALRHVAGWGLVDVFRHHHPEGGLFTWWDYRGMSFFKNRGLRIDHVFATAGLAARSSDAMIDREARKGQNASDHAPVLATFDEI